MRSAVKVCVVSHSAMLRGAERCLLESIAALRTEGCEVFAILPSEGPLYSKLLQLGVPLRVHPYSWWKDGWVRADPPGLRHRGAIALERALSLPRTLWTSMKLAQDIRRWRCDVVLSNTIVSPTGAVAAQLARVPHVWYVHEFGDLDHGFHFELGVRRTARLIGRLSKYVIFNSRATFGRFAPMMGSTPMGVVPYAVTIPDGLDEDTGDLWPRGNNLRCLVLGAVTESKRAEDAVRAMVELRRRGLEVELVIAGGWNETYKAFLDALIRDGDFGTHVCFTGSLDDPLPTLRAADVLLMCSRQEAFGRVTVEAMKVGKLVIGAASGATRELIDDGNTGFLYPMGNHEALADRIQSAIRGPEHASELRRNGCRWARDTFSEKIHGQRLVTVLESALNRVDRSSPGVI